MDETVPDQLPLPLYRTVPTPSGSFRQHVIGPRGELHVPLTVVFEGLGQLEPRTAAVYSGVISRFVSWSERVVPEGVEAEKLPAHVIRFLREQSGCRCHLKGRRWHVTPIGQSSSWIRVVLSALLAYVDILIEYRLFSGEVNPLRGGGHGGIGGFLVRGGPWRPRYRHDPQLAVRMAQAAADDGWPQWALMVLTLLFVTGCRISEALDLRLADWLVSGCGDTVSAPNKGSAGKRVKDLILRPETVLQLSAYFDCERARRTGMTLDELRLDAVADRRLLKTPIFIGRWGDAPNPDSLRKLWRTTAKRHGISCSPHSARHWYVTDRVIRIKAEHGDNESRFAHELALLVEHVHWANPEMLHVYAQTLGLLSAKKHALTPFPQLSFDFFGPTGARRGQLRRGCF